MKRELICISCPIGCMLTVEQDGVGNFTVSGNACKRGELYGVKEVTAPTRTVTTTIRVLNGDKPRVSVRTLTDIPKHMVDDCIRAIKAIELTAPVSVGHVVLKNAADTGVDVVATSAIGVVKEDTALRIDKGINTIFFDLDGTLIHMDAGEFANAYFKALAAKAAPMGYDPKTIVDAVWTATMAMIKNDGSKSNMERFWTAFSEVPGIAAHELKAPFDGFYREEFDSVRAVTNPNPDARVLIDLLKKQGYTLVLATNPLFPLDGNLTRMAWVGLSEDDFDYISSYENSSYCKPSPDYYKEILGKLGKEGHEAIMIGNDAAEDLAAAHCGMDTFLVRDYLINSTKADISAFKQGMFKDLFSFFGGCGK